MNGLLLFIIGVGVVLPVGAGFALGAYRAAQTPGFYAGAIRLGIEATFPIFKKLFTKMTPDEREAWQRAMRQAEEWDHLNRRVRRDEH